jgi:hypothetical protein
VEGKRSLMSKVKAAIIKNRNFISGHYVKYRIFYLHQSHTDDASWEQKELYRFFLLKYASSFITNNKINNSQLLFQLG